MPYAVYDPSIPTKPSQETLKKLQEMAIREQEFRKMEEAQPKTFHRLQKDLSDLLCTIAM